MARASQPRHVREEAAGSTSAGARVLLLLVSFALTAFGLLMIYSASSVSAAASGAGSFAYVIRQLALAVVGAGIVYVGLRIDCRKLLGPPLVLLWGGIIVLILVTVVAGQTVKGATRWLNLGFISIQPSELAKPVIILAAAAILAQYYEERSIDSQRGILLFLAGVALPIGLILFQPDKGTAIILAVTILAMLYLAGFPLAWLVGLGVLALAFAAFLALRDEYSRSRVMTMFNPWLDPYDSGYQLIQGFYAFGRGGILGAGIGMSRQKYSYLPEAHNDFIFAIIGEELGLVGTLATIAAFVLLAYAGFKICRDAPDMAGRLIAGGCTTLIIVQALVNVMGVVGVMPMTGKPLPFLSYGGSSILSVLVLVALTASVSAHSAPAPAAASSRAYLRLSDEDDADAWQAPAAPMRVVEGGLGRSGGSFSGGNFRPPRIDLGPSAADRLRSGSRSSGR